MENITKFWIAPLPLNSPYMKPFRCYYIQNGIQKFQDIIKVHDSVLVILYNTTNQKLVFVRQFRAAVYHHEVSKYTENFENVNLKAFPAAIGITLELCGGMIDKHKSCAEIAREEVLEECGYDVPVERLEEILTFRLDTEHTGPKQYLYYCEVTDLERKTSGGGIDDEIIEVVELSLHEVRQMLQAGAEHKCPPSCLLGLMWFFANRATE